MSPRFLFTVVLLIAMGVPHARAADRIEMTVTRNKEPIGTHTITFAREGDRLHVDTKVEIAVKIAFLTVYRMHKASRETWEGGRMVAYTATIDDNGTISTIRVRPEAGKLAIDGPEGRVMAPLGTMMSGYWSEKCVTQTLLIDSSDGVLRRVATGKATPEKLGDRGMRTRRYRMTGDLTRDLWYGEDGRLVRVREIASDNSVIVTELKSLNRTN
jgi:hypothetical protein